MGSIYPLGTISENVDWMERNSFEVNAVLNAV